MEKRLGKYESTVLSRRDKTSLAPGRGPKERNLGFEHKITSPEGTTYLNARYAVPSGQFRSPIESHGE